MKPEDCLVSPSKSELLSVVVRLAGDAGDGMQLAGTQLGHTAALAGNGFYTLPDLPAEIRAPAGSLAGVSGFQIHFGSMDVHTPGDQLNALVAMNPAALKTHLKDLEPGGILIVNRDAFGAGELRKAGYSTHPLEDGSLAGYRLLAVPITALNRAALTDPRFPGSAALLSPREADRCKNFFALGLIYWLYERPLEPTLHWIQTKLAGNPAILEANRRSLHAGYNYGETTELVPVPYRVPAAAVAPGRYRKVTGHEAMALGLVAAAEKTRVPLFFAGYPSTPSGELLHRLVGLKRFGVKVFQAEDEIAALGSALGAAFGGALAATASSGPGLSLKSEGLGLAVMTELPLVVIDYQRAGPSTGLPSKTEQADLLQAMFGRHGECPVAVLAPCSPADCFVTVYQAARLAVRAMTPVLVLADGLIASAAEPWRIPRVDELPPIPLPRPLEGQPFRPYQRDERLTRPWAVPGTPGLEHRIGGLEKDPAGDVSYDPLNHEAMVRTRAARLTRLAEELPALMADGPDEGDLLLVGWGGTFGAIRTAVQRARRQGLSVAHAHLRYLHPMPANTGDLLRRYRKVLVPELNSGQLLLLLRAAFLVDAMGLNKVQGRPFQVREIEEAIWAELGPKGAGNAF
jgi:2-oxoglutarate/2-oxoacid ferredoxin oxidoreductase subunit alpha